MSPFDDFDLDLMKLQNLGGMDPLDSSGVEVTHFFLNRFHKRLVFWALPLILVIIGCQAPGDARPNPVPPEPPVAATEAERLAKLCRVWGYVKYTHPVFLLGQRDWDEDLLELIPQVRALETDQEVNALLHEWFVGLGEIDYGTDKLVASWAEAAEEERLVITDTSWTTDVSYLGEDLAACLGQLGEIPDIRRSKGPVYFLQEGETITYPFFNENQYLDMDYSDAGYRLLGLFRAWNVLEYYFPYHDLLEEDWAKCLDEFIPSMLEGTDRNSYMVVILTLLAGLHDNHVVLDTHPYDPLQSAAAREEVMTYPLSVTEAEGELVVSAVPEDCPLRLGDVILRVNGVAVEETIQTLKASLPCSREEIFLSRYAGPILQIAGISNPQAEVTALRDGVEEAVLCEGLSVPGSTKIPQEEYLLLEGNIGLINPANLQSTAPSIMENLRDTDGLIIDLRQYPGMYISTFFSYFTTEYVPVFIHSSPSRAVPGAYVREVHSAGYQPSDEHRGVYYYDKPVVILINEFTQSAGEWAAWSIGKGEKVVLMGQNTSGALNRIADVPLPGGIWFTYTAVRADLDDGSQLQRVGITPDIPVSRTIQGVKEDRDELMEAAVAYLLNPT